MSEHSRPEDLARPMILADKLRHYQSVIYMYLKEASAHARMLIQNAEHMELTSEQKGALVRARIELANGHLSLDTLEVLCEAFPYWRDERVSKAAYKRAERKIPVMPWGV